MLQSIIKLGLGATLLRSVLAVTTTSSAATPIPSYPAPLPCVGEGCTTWTVSLQDFNILQINGTYYRVSKDNGPGTGLVLASAPSLAGNWTLLNPILPGNLSVVGPGYNQGGDNVVRWTPELHLINGTIYCYYAIEVINKTQDNGGFDIRVATTQNMASNSWVDHGSLGIPRAPSVYAAIDASILTYYLNGSIVANQIVWGSFALGLFGTQLNSTNPLIINSSAPIVEYIEDHPTSFNPNETDSGGAASGGNKTSTSFHIQMNGYVYFWYSQGSCCDRPNVSYAYVTKVCRATTPDGPFYDRAGLNCGPNGAYGTLSNQSGTVFLQSHTPNGNGFEVYAPGSPGVVRTPQGPVFTYQYYNQSIKYPVPLAFNMGYNWLAFDNASWPYLSDTPTGNIY